MGAFFGATMLGAIAFFSLWLGGLHWGSAAGMAFCVLCCSINNIHQQDRLDHLRLRLGELQRHIEIVDQHLLGQIPKWSEEGEEP